MIIDDRQWFGKYLCPLSALSDETCWCPWIHGHWFWLDSLWPGSFSTMWKSSILQTVHFNLQGLGLSGGTLINKDWSKGGIQQVCLLSVFCYQGHSPHSAVGSHSPWCSFCLIHLKNLFLLLTSFIRFNSKRALAFHVVPYHALTMFLYSSQAARPFFHIPETYFFHLSFPWVSSLSMQVSWCFWLVSCSQVCTNLKLVENGTSVLTSALGPPYLLMLEGQSWLSWSVCLAVLLSQQILGWLKCSMRTSACEATYSCVLEGFINFPHLIRKPVANTQYCHSHWPAL